MEDIDKFYSDSQKKIQAELGCENLANAMATAIVFEDIQQEHKQFISTRDYFFLSTVNANGEPTVSYKGGHQGFVKVLSATKLAFPSYDGNGMFYSMGNIAETTKIGMLFIDMETPHRVRLQGTATVTKDAGLMSEYPGANMVVEVEVTSVFINCARYIHKHKRLETSKYVPDAAGNQPFPAWKRIDFFQDILPADDSVRANDAGGTITAEQYQEKLERGDS
jgi:predicted pyridoxine 5'-phosphate oxidase superfamily flavin-nucleotide-binding protein